VALKLEISDTHLVDVCTLALSIAKITIKVTITGSYLHLNKTENISRVLNVNLYFK
jgi:hypothetical protein